MLLNQCNGLIDESTVPKGEEGPKPELVKASTPVDDPEYVPTVGPEVEVETGEPDVEDETGDPEVEDEIGDPLCIDTELPN